jgi:dTMP kinase
MLKEWLEVQGYAVIDTGWTRSKLVGKAITDAKEGHSLHRLTYCLMYATDLADRMEYQIIPALRSGFIVLADRYIYTLLARGVGAAPTSPGCAISSASPSSPIWFSIFSSAWKTSSPASGSRENELLGKRPGHELRRRSLRQLRRLSTELIQQFNAMSEEFGFHCVDARQDPRAIQRQLRREVAAYLESCHYSAPGTIPTEP